MTVRPHLLTLLLAALAALAVTSTGCDNSEDPFLLNPPAPDSTRIRVVNLRSDQPIDAIVASFRFADDVPGFHVSQYYPLVFGERTALMIDRAGVRDSFENMQLPQGTQITYFLLPRDTSGTILISKQTSVLDRSDMAARDVARVVLINAVPGSSLILREGCQSGDTVIPSLGHGTSGENEMPAGDLSLYLFTTNAETLENALISTARLTVEPGSITYLIAAQRNGDTALYALDADGGVMRPLVEAPPETRTEAFVEVLNGVADAIPISARIDGANSPVTTSLAPLSVSPLQTVQACYNPSGDKLIVSWGSSDSATGPLSLSVGRRSLIAVYGSGSNIRSLLLDRTGAAPAAGQALVRAVNLSVGGAAAISIGGGSAGGDTIPERPFGALAPGQASGYVRLPASTLAFLLNDNQTGEYLDGGFHALESGRYTIFITAEEGSRRLRLLRDDSPGTTLLGLQTPGNSAIVFNMIADNPAVFRIGDVPLDTLRYSYARTTVVPSGQVTISVNGQGSLSIDGSAGSYTIGATGSGSDLRLISFLRPPPVKDLTTAAVRFLNAVTDPDAATLVVRENDANSPEIATISYGVPSPTPSLDRAPRKYSFLVTRPGETEVLARIDGVELTGGRNYLLVVGSRRSGESVGGETLRYGVLWMQE